MCHQAPTKGAHLQHTGVGFVIKEQRQLTEAVDGVAQQGPFLGLEPASAESAAFDAHLHRQQAIGELLLTHFQTEHSYRQLVQLGYVFGDIQHDRGFSHGGPTRHDDQIAALQALGDGIEVVEVHRDAGDGGAEGAALNLVEGACENLGGGSQAHTGLFLADSKNLLLGLVEHLLHGLALIEAEADDFVARSNQLAPEVFIHHQAGHLVNGGGAESALHQFHQAGAASHLFQVSGVGEPSRHGSEIRGLALAMQHQSGAVDLPVGAQVKSLRLENVCHPANGIRVQQDAPKYRLFGLQVLGGKAIGSGFKTTTLAPKFSAPLRSGGGNLGGARVTQGNGNHGQSRGRRRRVKPKGWILAYGSANPPTWKLQVAFWFGWWLSARTLAMAQSQAMTKDEPADYN